ncbi:TetR/AcrR family transcriptional regulator [uncultured Ramlibacter sp.]|uniref:TetR/AcrR family transcriptional regulator n=1 Tax=uncultured Ramlibacter sp. TaxID=260755 RepID=UPI00261EAA08|nr:TetR/AcrR family transcriptional regulator [uncultured Ramlibacter sp.]
MENLGKRAYRSQARTESAARTLASVLDAGRYLFSRKGIDATTIAQIAERAKVSEATVYATVRSKAGLLQGLMQRALFGPQFQQAQERLKGVSDPQRSIALSAHVARAIYEGESSELSLLMKASAFSPELRKSQQGFENLRRQMQKERIDALFDAGRERPGLTREAAATLLWMYTGREIYHKLVLESGWQPQAYQDWLEQTLAQALTAGGAAAK